MKVSTRSAVAVRRKSKQEPSHRFLDIVAVVLLAAAIIAVFGLATGNSGWFGHLLGGTFRTLFGRGSWAVPALLTGLSIAAFKGPHKLAFTHLTYGVALIFLAMLGILAQAVSGDFLALDALTTGGYIGAILGLLFTSLFGAAKVVGLSAVGLIGLILCVDVPVRELLRSAKSTASDITQRTLTKRPPSEKRTERRGPQS